MTTRYTLSAHNGGSYWLHSHYAFHHELGLAIPVVVDGLMPPLYPLGREIDELDDAVMFLEDYCAYAREDPDVSKSHVMTSRGLGFSQWCQQPRFEMCFLRAPPQAPKVLGAKQVSNPQQSR